MKEWSNKYIVVEDALASRIPSLLPVSAICDSLSAARAILAISEPPKLLGLNEFGLEEVAKTVVIRGEGAKSIPRPARIYRTFPTDLGPSTGCGRSALSPFQKLHEIGVSGSMHLSQGRLPEAKMAFELAVELAKEQDVPQYHVAAVASLGMVHAALGELATAREMFQSAAGEARRHGFVAEEQAILQQITMLPTA